MKYNFLNNKNILVTGGTGYLGSALLQVLNKYSCQVTILCRDENNISLENSNRLKIIVGDLLDKEIWKVLLKKADYVFHLAGLEYNRNNFDHDLDIKLNFLSVVNLLQVCIEYGYNPKIIFTSSSNIAKSKEEGQVSELDQDDPMSIWSLHKLIAESYLNHYSQHQEIKSVCLRLPNLYGPSRELRTFSRSAVNKMIESGILKEQIILNTNKQSLRDFLYIEDASNALLLSARFINELQEKRYYYVGSDIGYTYSDAYVFIKDSIFEILGKSISKRVEITKMGEFEMRSFIANSTKFRSITGFKPEVSFTVGIKNTILSFLKLKEML